LIVDIAGKTSACSGRSITICANTSGGTGGNTYLWQPGGATTPCITVSPAASITYSVTVADNCGTVTTASAALNINPYPAVGLLADVYQGCSPLCIQFHNTTSNAGATAQYVWTFGNGDTLQSRNPIYCYTNSGSYDITLTVTSDSGCSSTLKKVDLITVYNKPVAAFTLSPQPTTILNPTIQFTSLSTDKYGISEWLWNFGDGTDSNSTAADPSHTYQDTGKYCATLIAMNAHGCVDTVTNCLVIGPDYSFYIPSAFSPNGDSKNETFQPKGQYIKSFEMYIFDRWGMKLYHTTDITKGWNGTVGSGSTVAQEDTYVYKIFITDSQGKQHSYIGNVTLLK
jgi:gliding motility-associated-like protein